MRKEKSKMRKITFLVLLVFLSTVSFAQSKRVLLYNYQPEFEELFREPFETLAIYTADGKTITITNYLEDSVYVTIEEIKKYMNSVGDDLASIKIIVHNHLVPSRWSFRDKKFFHKLKREGFRGQFVLYFPCTNNKKLMAISHF
jgi:hypothetical protein